MFGFPPQNACLFLFVFEIRIQKKIEDPVHHVIRNPDIIEPTKLSTNIQHRCHTISLSRKFFFSEINGFFVTPPPPKKKKKRGTFISIRVGLLASQWKKNWVSRVDSMLRYFNGSGGGNFRLILMLWRSQVRIVGFSHFRGNPFWNHFRTVHLGFTPNPECNRHYQDYYLSSRES